MSGFRGAMADDIIVSAVRTTDAAACAQSLLAAGWRATHVAAWLDDAMRLATTLTTAQDRCTIIRDMALAGDALPSAIGVSSLNLPGVAHVAPGLSGAQS